MDENDFSQPFTAFVSLVIFLAMCLLIYRNITVGAYIQAKSLPSCLQMHTIHILQRYPDRDSLLVG